jgi:hypothetical protein
MKLWKIDINICINTKYKKTKLNYTVRNMKYKRPLSKKNKRKIMCGQYQGNLGYTSMILS